MTLPPPAMRRRTPLFIFILAGLIPFIGLLVWVLWTPAEIELRWKLRKGQVLRYRTTSQDAAMTDSCVYAMKVLEVDDRQVATIVCTCEAAATKSSSWDYDSERDKGEVTNAVAKAFVARLGKSVTLRMNPRGHVEEINGILASTVSKLSAEEFPYDTLLFPTVFSADGDLVWYIPLPEGRVRTGQSWFMDVEERPIPFPNGRFRISCRLEATEKDLAKIRVVEEINKASAGELKALGGVTESATFVLFAPDSGALVLYRRKQILRDPSGREVRRDFLEVQSLHDTPK